MICTRCNRRSNESEKCSKCGTRLATLASQQRRGWVAFGAGAFLVVFVAAVWVWIDRLFASSAITGDPAANAAFLGKLNVAFALIVISGVLGMINGWKMAQTGLRNNRLIFALVIVFAAALLLAFWASAGYQSA